MKLKLFTFVLSMVCLSLQTSAQVIHVPAEQATIQAAINAASEGDTVLVAEGTYYENLVITGKAITLASEFILDGKSTHISKTIIDGSQPVNPAVGSVVFLTGIPNSNTTLKGFTLTGGSGSYVDLLGAYVGGAVLLFNNGAVIENNIVTDNSIVQNNATFPGIGGAFLSSNTIIIRHNKILRNSTITSDITSGGGIGLLIASQGVTVRINHNIISDNSLTCTEGYSTLGGGIEIETAHGFGPDIQINNNTITGNALHSETSMGGGMYIEFWENVPPDNSTLKVQVFNNIITNNYAQDKGGGLAFFSMGGITQPAFTYPIVPLVMNNTLLDNEASDGAGVFTYDLNLLLLNNILWDETDGENCREIFQDYLPDVHFRSDLTWFADNNDGNLYAFNNCIKGGEAELQGAWFGENNIEAYPKVNPALFKPLPKSPCLGTGAESVQIDGELYTAPAFDFYDNPRPDAETGLVDMGAVMSDNLRRTGQRNQYGWQATKESKLKSATLEHSSISVDETPCSISIYPNPITKTARVSLSNHALITGIEIIDVTGKLVQQRKNLQNTTIMLNRNELSNGIYLLRIHADRTYLKKVILQ
ncbi:T9SS type A sorting domain-containing protein [Saccharicrinis sp. FJH54]|uniref:T9SS type A sorting domain-containing protein n=1 Tax=Saccharicrinis sp. FJH54 TaxID=3344665 RepID=UPI0035D42316